MNWLGQVALLVLLLVAWQLVTNLNPTWTFFVGSPTGVVQALLEPDTLRRLPDDILATTSQALAGFLIGVGGGTALGLLLWFSRSVFVVLQPYLVVLGTIPIFALGPIFVFWFGTGLTSKVALIVVATFSLAVFQAYQGARECDQNLIRLGTAFGASRLQLLLKLVAPSSFNWVMAGARTNISLALLGSVVGEFVSSRQGLGNLLLLAEGLYNVNLMIGCIALIGLGALLMNLLTLPLELWARQRSPELDMNRPAEFRSG